MKISRDPILLLAVLFLAGVSHVACADTVDARCDLYPNGSDHASRVLPCTFSQRQGYVAIDLGDGVRHELSPQDDGPGSYLDEKGRKAIRTKGLGKKGQIYRLADETIYVYWDTAGLPGQPEKKTTNATPSLLPPPPPAPVPFDQTLELQGISFHVASANSGSSNELTITPKGLAIDNTPVVVNIDGQITRAEVDDLNVDSSPEIYVYVRGAGSGSYGSLVACSANKRKSLSEIYLPPIAESSKESRGYMWHDDFAVVEGTLVRRFPVYKDGDTNAAPTGGVRQLQYKLVQGEANWQLKLDRVVEY